MKKQVADFGGSQIAIIEQLPVSGFYMPEAILQFGMNGREYLVATNGGNIDRWGKTQENFASISEFIRYFTMKKQFITHKAFATLTKAEVQEKLVQMKKAGNYDKLHIGFTRTQSLAVIGGEPFSIWDATTMELVFDSENHREAASMQRVLEQFQAQYEISKDIELAIVHNRLYAFFGCEQCKHYFLANEEPLQAGQSQQARPNVWQNFVSLCKKFNIQKHL